jgi:hypothetical protein
MSRHEATSFSPFYLMHGREAICPLDLLIETPVEAMPPDGNRYAEQLVERLKVAFAAVNRHTTDQVERMKRRYDANVRVKEFRLHQLVLYYYPRRYQGRTPKWSKMYIGPYRIVAVLNDVNFVIKKSPRSKGIVVHIDKMKAYFGPQPACWNGAEEPAEEAPKGD